MSSRSKTGSWMLPFFLFIWVNTAAQAKVETYRIDYRVVLFNKYSDYMLDNDGKPVFSAYVNLNNIRVEEYSFRSSVQISDLKDSLSFLYFTDSDSTKIAQPVPLASYKIGVDVASEDLEIWDSSRMKLSLTDETESIAGFDCYLARFSLGASDEILVWYVKGLPQLFWGEYEYLTRVPGLPLKIVSNIKDSDFDMGIIATYVEKIQVNPSLFEMPAVVSPTDRSQHIE